MLETDDTIGQPLADGLAERVGGECSKTSLVAGGQEAFVEMSGGGEENRLAGINSGNVFKEPLLFQRQNDVQDLNTVKKLAEPFIDGFTDSR